MPPLPDGTIEEAARLGVPLGDRAREGLERLLARLAEENEVQNLTAIEEPDEAAVDHLLDSLALAAVAREAGTPLEEAVLCVDIGTGGGFPGIPLALAFPTARWLLLESEYRKVQWLEAITGELGLRNVEVLRIRGRELRHGRADVENAVDVVTARAVGELGKICREARGLLRPGGVLLCPKGRKLTAEEMALGDREAGKSHLEPGVAMPMAVPGRKRVCVVYRRP